MREWFAAMESIDRVALPLMLWWLCTLAWSGERIDLIIGVLISLVVASIVNNTNRRVAHRRAKRDEVDRLQGG